jgi:hypothetical protein
MDTVCVSVSLKIPATEFGPGDVGVLGMAGSEAPAIVAGAPLAMVERYEARESLVSVTECSQSDLPVEMTTWRRLSDKRTKQNGANGPVGGKASRNLAFQKLCLLLTRFYVDILRGLRNDDLSQVKKKGKRIAYHRHTG